jgi:hypothetical protein
MVWEHRLFASEEATNVAIVTVARGECVAP